MGGDAIEKDMKTTPATKPHVPRLALTPAEAAESIGCSAEHFRQMHDAELPWIRKGRKRVVPMKALEDYLMSVARKTLE